MLLKSLLPGRTAQKKELWALRDVSFAVEPGETVGVIGRNGAGKTTLLRLIAAVTRPTEGVLRVHGRIAPLISVGVGFHPEMSGRENVLVNGMLLGLSRRDVARRFDEIVAFAELEEFIDTPVKFYSSGQYVRLGFSVAIHCDPEILLVDEVLAVGDMAFQLKCFEKMRVLQSAGTTIVLVTHSLHAIRLLCPRALLFSRGQLVVDGPAEVAVGRYHELLSDELMEEGTHGPVAVTSCSLIGADGPTHHPTIGEQLTYRATLRFNRPIDSPFLAFQVTSDTGIVCYSVQTRAGQDWRRFEAGDTVDIEVPFTAQLGGGTYRLSMALGEQDARALFALNVAEIVIYMAPRAGSFGFSDLAATIYGAGQELSDHGDLTLKAADEAGVVDCRPMSI